MLPGRCVDIPFDARHVFGQKLKRYHFLYLVVMY